MTSRAAISEPASPRLGLGRQPVITHSGMSISRYFGMHMIAALLPITAGIIMYGWRAVGLIAFFMLAAAAACGVWQRIGARGRMLRRSNVLWFALLLSLMLPAHWFATNANAWALIPASALLLVIVCWLFGGAGAGRVHPVLVSHLVLAVLFTGLMPAQAVLQRQHLIGGDVCRSAVYPNYSRIGWINLPPRDGADAVQITPAAQQLTAFTHPYQPRARNWVSLDSLLRDELPPLEDLIVGGQPGPIGATCNVAVIVGGLFLLYRGVIDFRIPLFASLTAFAAFLFLPIPLVITETGINWINCAVTHPAVGAAKAVTFAGYELMAGPLLFTAFFLATSPIIRPLTGSGRVVFAILLGAAAAVAQLYLSVSVGAYVALLAMGFLTPMLDGMFARCRRPV